MLPEVCLLEYTAPLQINMVQLKCNLMPAYRSPDENARVNLQTGTDEGLGACQDFHQLAG